MLAPLYPGEHLQCPLASRGVTIARGIEILFALSLVEAVEFTGATVLVEFLALRSIFVGDIVPFETATTIGTKVSIHPSAAPP